MKYAPVTDRLANLGGKKWEVHFLARSLAKKGRKIIELTIGEPDVPTPPALTKIVCSAMENGRTGYSNGRGEPALLAALSSRYSQRMGRPIGTERILCFPGTQTALFAILMGVAALGDEVLVGDPMYATYEGVIATSGAVVVPVPLRAENGFRISAADIAARITPRSRAILLNTPHNPTGAVLSGPDIEKIGALARQHDLWIISDEVYDELLFDGATFTSPLAFEDLEERVVVASSISKSYAAPGFRSGWCVGPAEFAARLLPLSETMLFGNQPFIADMTAKAVAAPSAVAAGMRVRFARRAALLAKALDGVSGLRVNRPQAGMFVLLDISATGMTARDYALDLLETAGVAVMPGTSFGTSLSTWVRVALTVGDAEILEACQRIARHARATTNPGSSR